MVLVLFVCFFLGSPNSKSVRIIKWLKVRGGSFFPRAVSLPDAEGFLQVLALETTGIGGMVMAGWRKQVSCLTV